MRALVQRVTSASVSVNQTEVARINRGLLVFIGFCHSDTHSTSNEMIDKLLHLRLFEDSHGKINDSVQEIDGEILVVSQFTLYADCNKGRRPNFMEAMKPSVAAPFYDEFMTLFRSIVPNVQSGIFGEMMSVKLENEGPFTLMVEK